MRVVTRGSSVRRLGTSPAGAVQLLGAVIRYAHFHYKVKRILFVTLLFNVMRMYVMLFIT